MNQSHMPFHFYTLDGAITQENFQIGAILETQKYASLQLLARESTWLPAASLCPWKRMLLPEETPYRSHNNTSFFSLFSAWDGDFRC